MEWARYEMRRAPLTIARYREALNWVIRDIGDLPVSTLNVAHVLRLRRKMDQRGCGEARVAAILNALRSFLRFCHEVVRVAALDPRQIRVPRIPRQGLGRYLSRRRDDEDPLFVARGNSPRRLSYDAVKSVFRRVTQLAHLRKKVTAHVLRHAVATTLLFNGCPIGHIKELLGHERLDMTCRYYLGVDVRAAKEAHRRFLRYD